MTTMTMSDAEQMLAKAGVTPPKHEPTKTEVVLAPHGADPHLMKPEEIAFDPALLDGFPSLTGDGMNEASKHVFALYKSYGRNKERNSLLHHKISTFIVSVRDARNPDKGHVKEAIKTNTVERELAALMASQGVTDSDLAEALQLLAAKRAVKEDA